MNSIKVKFPARISMNLFTYPDRLVKGGYGVAIKMDNYLSVIKSNNDSIKVTSTEKNVDLLVRYYLEEFRKISNMDFNVSIVLELDNRFKNHVGFAFNSNIACALYFAFNKLLNDKYTKEELLKYLFVTYAELNGSKISKNDSTCMISQYCAFNGGMNVIDDLKLIYNYKFSNDYRLALIHFEDKVTSEYIVQREKKKSFNPMNISVIRKILKNQIIPDLNKNNIESLKKNNLNILEGSTRILRCEGYVESNEILSLANRLQAKGIVGLTSSSSTIYFISKNMKNINFNKKVDYYEIENNGITIIEVNYEEKCINK